MPTVPGLSPRCFQCLNSRLGRPDLRSKHCARSDMLLPLFLQNKAKALKVLRARLYDLERQKLAASRSEQRSEQVEQIS